MSADTYPSGQAVQWFPPPADDDQPVDLAAVARLGRAQFRRALIRRLRVARAPAAPGDPAGEFDSPLITEHPEAVADVVMGLANLIAGAEAGNRCNCEG